MGTAKYIGRVGALAVALGVGAAISNTPASRSPTRRIPVRRPRRRRRIPRRRQSRVQRRVRRVRLGSDSSSKSESSSSRTQRRIRRLNVGFAGSTSGSTSTGDSQRTVGTHTSKESTNETINETTATGEVAGESTTADTPAPTEATPTDQTVADATTTAPETPPEAPAAAEAPRSAPVAASDRKQRQFEQRAGGARGVDPVTRSTAVNAAPSQPDISQVAPAVVDVAVKQPAAPQAVTAFDGEHLPGAANQSGCYPTLVGGTYQAPRQRCERGGVGFAGVGGFGAVGPR